MSSVKGIIDLIDAKTAEKAEKLMKEAEELRELRLKEANEKAAAIAESATAKAEKESKAQLARHEASAKLKAKYRMLEVKESLIKDVLDSATTVATKEIEGKKCKEILNRLALDGGTALGSQSLELVLPQKMKTTVDTSEVARAIAKTTGDKVSVTIAKDTIRSSGGLIIRTTDQSKSVDNTLEARAQRLAGPIRDAAATILFSNKAKSD
jgi:vacuolar-type H+-ATPase subunit E/Vma4